MDELIVPQAGIVVLPAFVLALLLMAYFGDGEPKRRALEVLAALAGGRFPSV
ncbi:hypothetical protein ACFC26_08080 [Kitasatospora purpeofusca]|uniref:hypothetical protein n=1 Tax=Kitasatospora purpeofusca TaxID=67352 RepID=UPI0035E34405